MRIRWILAAGVLLRALLIATTRGTSDLALWEWFVWALQKHGMSGAWAHAEKLNHPPLGALIVWGLHELGPLAITLRVSQVLADVATALLLARIAQRLSASPRFVAGLFFLSPVAILTSAFYCNTDSLLVMLIVASVLLMLEGRDAASGAVFACACGIKILPVLALPLLLMKGRMRFAAAYGVVIATIFLPVMWRDPLHFIRNVAGYAGSGETWGLALPATLAGATATFLQLPRVRGIAYAAADLYNGIARVAVLAAAAFVTWTWARSRRADHLPAAVTLVFLGAIIAAPRVAPGYFLWFLPLLPFAVSRRLALAVHGLASAHLVFAYTLYSHGFPWSYADFTNTTNPWWLGRAVDAGGLPLWLLCIGTFVAGTRALTIGRRCSSPQSSLPGIAR